MKHSLAAILLLVGGCRHDATTAPIEDAQTSEIADANDDAEGSVDARDATLTAEEIAHIEAEVDAYLRADDPTTTLLDKLDAEYRDVPFSVFENAVRKHRGIALKAGTQSFEWTDPMLGTTVRYEAYVPDKIAGASVERVPLLLFLHWAGGDGPGVIASDFIRAAADAYGAILVAPSADPSCDWSGNEDCMSQVVLLLQRLKRKLPIDDDRVVLSGFSMGGRGSFSTSAAYPSALAGVVPVAASIGAINATTDVTVHQKYCCPHAENFGNLRLHYISGGTDLDFLLAQNRGCDLCFRAQGADYVYEEIPTIGHEIPPKEWTAAIGWTFGKPRTHFPSKVVFNLLPQTSSKYPGGVTFHQKLHVSEYWAFPYARIDVTKPARVQATQTGNDVELTTNNLANVTVYFSTEAFDLSKNVRVSAGGKILLDEKIVPDARLLLTEARARSERSVTFAAERVVVVP